MMAEPAGDRSAETGLWPVPLWLSLAWGLAESTFFFIVPDMVLGWTCLAGWRHGARALVAVMLGSLAGGLLIFGLAATWPEATRNAVAHVPFVRDTMFATVEASYAAHGALGMLYGPTSGIPYKIYAVLAPQAFGVLSFAICSIPARLERLALSWLVFALLGKSLAPIIARHRLVTAAIYALLWAGIYAFYWTRT